MQLTLERALEFFVLELLVTITRYDLHLSQASRPASPGSRNAKKAKSQEAER